MSILKVWYEAGNVWVEIPVSTLDASIMGYSPADLADWLNSLDPGNVDDALDQAASRIKTTEAFDDDALLTPIGLSMGNLTDVTVTVSATSYFLYLGRTLRKITTATFLTEVTTLWATGLGAWAEVGLFTGDVVANGAASLSRVGSTDVTAIFNTTGIKAVTISLSGVSVGDALWLAYGSTGGIGGAMFELRGMLADRIRSGGFQSTLDRISTMSVPRTMTLESTTRVPAWARLVV